MSHDYQYYISIRLILHTTALRSTWCPRVCENTHSKTGNRQTRHFDKMNISHLIKSSCWIAWCTVYPKKYAHGFCFAVLCCGYTLTDFPISIRLTSLALWQSNDCPSASKATLMNMDKYFMWIHYERLHNHNKAKHNKTVCIFLGIYCISMIVTLISRWKYRWRVITWLTSRFTWAIRKNCLPLKVAYVEAAWRYTA